ncbi:alcohol dehydrogenase [Rhodococcus sp. ACS1]|uniref:zinc-binding dehydrogenase n=1 Tax=unclassified Rhodococcus (in: high G+C Gram-positive bacteria) TaxID=192944 RepID=UPI00077A1E7A|nr:MULTISPECIES: zinc-binding dehydrogenase [unclassified Rhodococcus (in: high G+C Gram-positive bacteria)]KXX59899.1 alcohol dehydrogenase [Rhodococcus sp. LB1]PBC35301.1 alcohol dehydrogenase [Rhodococcus sp. ACS1]
MATGKAAVLVETNRIETWEVPVSDPEPGGLLVEVVIGGVCGSDNHIVTGEAGEMPFPIILGHEGVGRIYKLGAGVSADYASVPVEVGDLVYWAPIALCNRCYSCSVLEQTPCQNSTFFEHAEKPNWGSYQQYSWLPNGTAFYKIPDGAQPEALAALGCALPTAIMGYDQGGGVGIEDTVVIQGAGPVGLAASMVASVAGAREIIVIDQSPERLQVAKSMGATTTLSLSDLSPEQRHDQIWERSGPSGPNIVVEAAGALPAFPEGLDLTGNHGRYIVVGLWGAIGTREVSPRELVVKNMTVSAASFPKPKHYYQAMRLAARMQDRFPLTGLITHRYSIDEAASALDAVASGSAIKAIIDPSR